MTKRLSFLVAAFCGIALLVGSGHDAKADRRIALVIGNASYNNATLALSNPRNDAEDVATALRALGFEVIQALNATRREMDMSMAKFARLATDADTAMFYYAGHALQYQGRNYLMPTDAEVEDEISLRYQMVPIDDVRVALDRASGVKVMVLDACRNNPVVESLRRKSSGETRGLGGARGLARIDKTQGTVIAYSTAADEVAADGTGRNSPFTTAFLRRLREPGLEIEQLFRRVASDVNVATNGRQRPETYVSLLSDYYLNQTDRIAFDAIKDASDPAALRDFIAKFPTSSYASDARYRLQRNELEAQELRFQQARQQEAMRQLQEQSKTSQDAGRLQAEREAAAKQQAEREAAAKAQAEREAARLQAEATQRVLDEQKRIKLAGLERQDTISSPPGNPILQAPVTPATAAPVAPTVNAQDCEQDRAKLAALRSAPTLEAVAQLERDMKCDRLRPQVARLRESLSIAAPAPLAATPPPPKPVTVERPASPPPPAVIANTIKPTETIPGLKPSDRIAPERLATAKPDTPLPVTQDCKRDEERLSRLRAEPTFDKVAAFERELGCDKLRAQVSRLRESLAPAGTSSPVVVGASDSGQGAIRQVPPPPPPSSAAVQPREKNCDQDRARLSRVRAGQSRDELLRLERDLTCDELRPQVQRLKESLGG